MRILTMWSLVVVLPPMFVCGAFAWGHTGHMVVSQIAYSNLTSSARARVDRLIAVQVEPHFHGQDARGKPVDLWSTTGTFITAACWADDVKSVKDKDWHFLDLPFTPDGTVPQVAVGHGNVVEAISNAVRTLRQTNASPAAQAVALRYLVHLAGDIHQPLHCATRCTHEDPNGDRGGNEFPVVGASNLHSYWDSALEQLGNVERPLDAARAAVIRTFAGQCMKEFPRTSLAPKLAVSDVRTWAQESYEIATALVYQTAPNSKPKSSYVSQGRKVTRERLALAGYRLAEVLNGVFQ